MTEKQQEKASYLFIKLRYLDKLLTKYSEIKMIVEGRPWSLDRKTDSEIREAQKILGSLYDNDLKLYELREKVAKRFYKLTGMEDPLN